MSRHDQLHGQQKPSQCECIFFYNKEGGTHVLTTKTGAGIWARHWLWRGLRLELTHISYCWRSCSTFAINLTTASGLRDDIHKTWEAIRCVNFDLDGSAVEAHDGAGIDSGEHSAKCKQDGGEEQVFVVLKVTRVLKQDGAL
jgi:hypothetical protein